MASCETVSGINVVLDCLQFFMGLLHSILKNSTFKMPWVDFHPCDFGSTVFQNAMAGYTAPWHFEKQWAVLESLWDYLIQGQAWYFPPKSTPYLLYFPHRVRSESFKSKRGLRDAVRQWLQSPKSHWMIFVVLTVQNSFRVFVVDSR